MSAVETTKKLRDRSKPIHARVEIAHEVLKTTLIPRKNIVVLDWLFDMLSVDQNARISVEMWQLLFKLWPKTQLEGKIRTFKNHKFVSIVCQTLESMPSSKLVEVMVNCFANINLTVKVFVFQGETPAQLLLAYLNCDFAVQNLKFGEYVYDALKIKSKIFSKQLLNQQTLDLILKEPVDLFREFYLRDFYQLAGVDVVPSVNNKLDFVMAAMCECDLVGLRMLKLVTKFPEFIPRAIEIVFGTPNVQDASLLLELIKLAIESNSDYLKVLQLCLQYNPASLLAGEGEMLDLVLSIKNITPSLQSMLISKMSDLRKLPEFVAKWTPSTDPEVLNALYIGFEKLSANQICKVLTETTDELKLQVFIQCLSYRAVSHQSVKNVLSSLFVNNSTSDELKADILNVYPNANAKVTKHDNSFVVLRSIELGLVDNCEQLAVSAAKRFDVDSVSNDKILLRYFPTLEKYLSEHRIKKIIKRCNFDLRKQLASNHDLLECVKITNALIDVSIKQREVEILNIIPKQVYSWEQRHQTVNTCLSLGLNFEEISPIVLKLADSQNPPTLDLFISGILSKAQPSDAEMLLDILSVFKPAYLKEITAEGWQKCCIQCVLHLKNIEEPLQGVIDYVQQNYLTKEYIPAILPMLKLCPTQLLNELVKLIALSMDKIPRILFQLLCEQNYDPCILTAFFVYSNYEYEEDFIEYIKTLTTEKVTCLLYKAVDEGLYKVLRALIKSKQIAENSVNSNVMTVAILKPLNRTVDFWDFCDVLLREQPFLVSQFALESIIELVSSEGVFEKKCLCLSRIIIFKRHALRRRLHLIVSALTSLLNQIETINQSQLFFRLIDNLCNPIAKGQSDLTSQVAKERRHVSKHVGVLLQNIVLVIINNKSEVNTNLRESALLIIDLIFGDGLKSVSAGMDGASRAYLKSLFEYYKTHVRWSSD